MVGGERHTVIRAASEMRSRNGGPVSLTRAKTQVAYDEVGSVLSSARRSRVTELKSFRGLGRTPEIEGRNGGDDVNSILRSEHAAVADLPCQCHDRVFRLPESMAMDEKDRTCSNRLYQQLDPRLLPLCKHHFLRFMRNYLRKMLFQLYRHSDNAFGTMDMSGRGFVSVQDFLNAVAMKQVINMFNQSSKGYKISKKEIELFLVNSGYFRMSAMAKRTGDKELIIDYKSFKRVFFPYLVHANDKEE